MTNFPVWLLYHCSCVAETALRIFVRANYIMSGVLIDAMQVDLVEDLISPRNLAMMSFPWKMPCS